MLNISVSGYIYNSRSNTVGDTKVTNLRVLHNGYVDGKETTYGIDVAIWGNRAEYASNHGIKGNFFSGSGKVTRMEVAKDSSGNVVTDKSGNPVIRLEMKADNFEIVNRGTSEESSSSESFSGSNSNSGGSRQKAHASAMKYVTQGATDPF